MTAPRSERTTLPALPWRAADGMVVYDATGEIAVATVDPEDDCSGEVQAEIAELVAAAPTMRDAIRAALQEIHQAHEHVCAGHPVRALSALARAEEALAAAGGAR